MTATYDEIADWYEHVFLGTAAMPAADPIGITACLRGLLGAGSGTCLEIGCGTGVQPTVTGMVGKVGYSSLLP